MTNLPYWLRAFYAQGVSARCFRQYLEFFPNIAALFSASPSELLALGVPKAHVLALKNTESPLIDHDLAWLLSSATHHIISFDDPAYPPLLKHTADPPLVLFLNGNKENLQQRQVAIVGARNATPMGKQLAEYFAYCLAQAGFVITSGLALGIDAASHRGALSAEGRTIGVAGTGLFHVYPACHQSLVKDIIAKNGTVVSEFPLAAPPCAHHFPRRNRIIAGLCLGVLVVEAALKSGSLITARLAAEEGREVFALPGSIHQPLSRGCHYLIRQGAKLIETAQDILEELRVESALPVLQSKGTADNLDADLSPECQQILQHIGYEITPIDVITLRSGLTAGQVSSILLTLELHGAIQLVVGGYVRVTNRAINHVRSTNVSV